MNDDRTDLAAQASRRALARAAAKWERIAAASPKGAYAALLANYLTPTHRDDPARGCAFASLGSGDSMTDSSSCARSNLARPLLGLLVRSLSIRRSAAATRSRARSSRQRYTAEAPAACVSCAVPSPLS
jgi:TetR/AcrR family transcriptional repressor of nem operon